MRKKVLTSKKLKKSNFSNTTERLAKQEKQEKQILGLRYGTDCRKEADTRAEIWYRLPQRSRY
jgi:hypothetical protein